MRISYGTTTTFLIILILIWTFTSVISLQCYHCRSDKNSDCIKPTQKYLQNCNNTMGACRSIHHIIRSVPESILLRDVWIRECAKQKLSKCISLSQQFVTINVCDCTTKACNRATTIGKSLEFKLALVLIILACNFLYSTVICHRLYLNPKASYVKTKVNLQFIGKRTFGTILQTFIIATISIQLIERLIKRE